MLVEAAAESDSSCAWAWARAALASRTAWSSAVVLRVARVCPALTVSPRATSTEAMAPLTGNAAVTWLSRVAVPVKGSRWSIDPLATTLVR